MKQMFLTKKCYIIVLKHYNLKIKGIEISYYFLLNINQKRFC
jgi:hypothetical protein